VSASVFASGWDHPVKTTVDEVLHALGWCPPEWHREMKAHTEPRVGSVEHMDAVARAAGLHEITVERVDVPMALDAAAAVAWRWSMASHASFVASLDADRRVVALAETLHRLEPVWAPVTVPMIVLAGTARRRSG
jgi:hypothetical protein